MIKMMPKHRLRSIGLAAICAGLLVFAGLSSAQARVFFGFGMPLYFGPPVYAPPPVYYPPPAYYAPPPVVYAPPPAYAPQYAPQYQTGQSCYAGAYVCPMDRPVTPGSGCYCTVNGTRVWGRAS